MVANRQKYLITISFSETNPLEKRLVAHLRQVKENLGDEVKSQILRMMTILTDTYSIGEDPNSSVGDIEESLIRSMNSMSGEMSQLAAYCRTKHGIELTSESWRRFGLIPLAPFDLSSTRSNGVITDCPPAPESQPETTGQRLTRENQERSDEIDRQIHSAQPFIDPEVLMETVSLVDETIIAPAPLPVPDEDDDEDDDYDPDDDLTDEEYSAKVLARIPNNQVVMVYD